MLVRPFTESDLPDLIDLTIETFRPFYEDYVHPLLGDEVFRHQHGQWEDDYRSDVPTLHDPSNARFIGVGEIEGHLAGFVTWKEEGRPHHGQIYLLAVAQTHRNQGLGHELCRYAVAQMKSHGVEVVEVGTGDDAFHAAARALYESLGFTKIPIAGYLMGI
ncbi:MAG TPA: GNAT family N-acetyltransferase [Acidimicrobiales bacterium]|nr:GNAT family N-acetyltransferase [Acidimicrobiales bacterium]